MTNHKILIIEDEVALAKALAAVCERLGAEATLCASGQRGLQRLAKENFSLVILDLGLPDISGWRRAGDGQSINGAPAGAHHHGARHVG